MNSVVFVILYSIVEKALSACICGAGGLCKVYPSPPSYRNDTSAEPCRCDIVSRGIYVTNQVYCDTLVQYCQSKTCGKNGKCINGFGTFVCLCHAGWEGERCEHPENQNHSSLVHLWYPITRVTNWFPVIGGRRIFTYTGLLLEFDDGRSWNTTLQYCTETAGRNVSKLCRSIRNGTDCTDVVYKLRQYSQQYFQCGVPLPFLIERRTFINDVKGPVGQYHDVRVVISDENVVHLNVSYRVFLESSVLERMCPFDLEYSGCGKSKETAGVHTSSLPIVLKVATVFAGNDDQCAVRLTMYTWYAARVKLQGWRKKVGQTKGDDPFVFVPAKHGYHSGHLTFQIQILFSDVSMSAQAQTVGLCYLNLVRAEEKVTIIGAEHGFPCETEVEIKLEVEMESEFSAEYSWSCERKLCKTAASAHHNITFLTTQKCGEAYLVNVTVSQPEVSLTTVANTTLRFNRPNESLTIVCTPDCDSVNPLNGLTVTATRRPIPSHYAWSDSQGIINSTVCHQFLPNDVLIIEPNSLRYGSQYNFTVISGHLVKHFSVKTVQKPELHCKVEPPHGHAFMDKFNFSCRLSVKLPLHFWVFEGHHLVSFSTNPNLTEVTLTKTPVRVSVTNDLGFVTSEDVKVSLIEMTPSQKTEELKNLPTQMDKIWMLLHEKDYLGMANKIDWITKWIEPDRFPFAWKITLMNFLFRIQVCYYADCLGKTANSIRRLTSHQVTNGTQGVDDFLLKAGGTLYKMTRSFDQIAFQTPPFKASALHPLFMALHGAARQVLDFEDPTLDHPFLDEDIRQIHYRKVEKANEYTRKALSEMGLFITKHLDWPTWPFKLISEDTNESVTIVGNTVDYISCLVACCESKSFFEFQSSRSLFPVSATVIRFNKTSFWWTRSRSVVFAEMAEVHFYQLTNGRWIRKIHEPIRTFFETTTALKVMNGTLGGLSDDPVAGSNIWDIAVPRGHGTLLIDFSLNLVGAVQTLISFSILPEKEKLTSDHVLHHTRVLFEYHSGREDHVYIGIWPIRGLMEYNLNISSMRCLIWSERLWKSELCKIYGTIKTDIVCDCAHLSLINLETVAPEPKLVTTVVIYLYTEAQVYWYANLILLAILVIIFLMFATAIKLDKIKKSKKFVIFLEDNYPEEAFPYLVAVFTSWRCMAGTSAHVAIRLIGEKFNSRVHVLNPKERQIRLSFGQDSWFIIFTQQDLGRIEQIELWHDGAGLAADWYCTEVIIWEVLTGKRYNFAPKVWLSHKILCLTGWTTLIVSNKERTVKKNWKWLIPAHFKEQIREKHHWASLFVLHPRSFHSHLDRTIIFSIVVLASMSTTVYFFDTDPGPADDYYITIPNDFNSFLSSISVTFLVALIPELLLSLANHKTINAYVPLDSKIKNPKAGYMKRYIKYSALKAPVMVSRFYAKNYITILYYVVSALIFMACVGFIFNSGENLNRNKSLTWLTTFCLVILVEAVVISPAYLFMVSVLVAHATKQSSYDAIIDVDPMEDFIPFQRKTKRLAWALHYRVKPMYKPPLLDKMRENALNSFKYYVFDVTDLIIVFLLLMFTVFLIYTEQVKPNYYKNLQLTHFTQSAANGVLDLDSVRNRTRYFDYLRGTVIPALHRITWYNGKPLDFEMGEPPDPVETDRPSTKYRGFCGDYSTKLIGVPRLRQQRVSPESTRTVPPPFQAIFPTAYGHLSLLNEDTVSYLPEWKRLDGEVYYNIYKYWPSESTKTGWIIGPGWYPYSGGGYVEHLQLSSGGSLSDLINLELDNWLDNLTRTVFFAFNVYNRQVDQIASMVFITDCLPSGVYKSRTMIDSVYLRQRKGTVILMIATVSFILAMQVFCTVVAISKLGLALYFKATLGWVELVVILGGICALVVFILRLIQLTVGFEEVEAAPRNAYTPLYWKFHGNSLSLVVIGIFSLSVTSLAALIVHNLISIERMHYYSVSYFIAAVVLQIFAATYFSYSLYYFGSVRMLNLFTMVVFKETASTREVVGTSSSPSLLAGFLVFSVVFLRLNIATLVPIYDPTRVPFKLGPETIVLLALQSHLKSDRYLRMRASQSLKLDVDRSDTN